MRHTVCGNDRFFEVTIFPFCYIKHEWERTTDSYSCSFIGISLIFLRFHTPPIHTLNLHTYNIHSDAIQMNRDFKMGSLTCFHNLTLRFSNRILIMLFDFRRMYCLVFGEKWTKFSKDHQHTYIYIHQMYIVIYICNCSV